MAGDVGTVIGVLQLLNGDGFGDCEHVRLYVGGNQFVEAQPGGASCRATPPQAGP
jgi:cell wall-associated NlpC family hydrolase